MSGEIMFRVGARIEADVVIGLWQWYNMAKHYENVALADFDVVRSTQFPDDMSSGVCVNRCTPFQFDAI
jgi:hypothetical protein